MKMRISAIFDVCLAVPLKLTKLNKSEEHPKSSFLSGRIRVECYQRVFSKYKDFFSRLITTVFADKHVIVIYYFEIIRPARTFKYKVSESVSSTL